MDTKALPSADYLRKLLDYDPATGQLSWKPRGPELFSDGEGRYTAIRNSRTFNARHAGRPAFTNRNKSGFQGEIDDTPYLAHRVIWKMVTGEDPVEEIGHENKNLFDNRFANLKEVSRQDTTTNVGIGTKNTSGVLGVGFDNSRGQWRAQIGHRGQNNFLGRFDTKDEAIAARREAEARFGFHPDHGQRRASR